MVPSPHEGDDPWGRGERDVETLSVPLDPIPEAATLSGTLWKRSPAHPLYQPRHFTLDDGILSYISGKGEVRRHATSPILASKVTRNERVCSLVCLADAPPADHGRDGV